MMLDQWLLVFLNNHKSTQVAQWMCTYNMFAHCLVPNLTGSTSKCCEGKNEGWYTFLYCD